jgi:hypothetical protein
VDLERVNELRVNRGLKEGKDDASDDAGSRSTSADDTAMPSTAASSPPGSLLGGSWYSISLSGFVVTEWFSIVTSMPGKQKGGKTRTLAPEEIVKVELDIGEGRVEAVGTSKAPRFTATWTRPDGMRFPIDARVRVTYKAHNDVLETRPLKVILRDNSVASQCCVLQ